MANVMLVMETTPCSTGPKALSYPCVMKASLARLHISGSKLKSSKLREWATAWLTGDTEWVYGE